MRLDGLFSSGRAVDVILAVVAVECVFLIWRRKAGGRSPATLDLLLTLAPGVLLLLALRASLTGVGWPWIAAFLAASFPFHVGDLIRRWR